MMNRLIRALATVLSVAVVAALGVVGLAAPANAATDGLIAFVKQGQIYTIQPSGAGLTKLTTTGINYGPQWSPDGNRIAYIVQTGSKRDIWMMNANGSGKRAVTRTGDVTTNVAWNPLGGWLAFGKAGVLNRISSNSTRPTAQPMVGYDTNHPWADDEALAQAHPLGVDTYLAWSADNRIALFGHNDEHDDDSIDLYNVATKENRQLWTTGSEASGHYVWRDLFFTPANQLGLTEEYLESGDPFSIWLPGFTSKSYDRYASPSPSGTRMVFVNDPGTPTVMIATATGANRQVLTQGHSPDWQPRP